MAAKKAVVDTGLQQIDAYERAIVSSHMDRVLTGGGYTTDGIEQERATVTALAATIAAGLRLDYLSRQQL
jgi:hypothetical protein